MRARKVNTYDGRGRYRTPPAPPRVVAGCAALALVVGALFAAEGDRLGACVAGLAAVAFLVFAPRLAGHAPAGSAVFAHAAFMFTLITAERFWYGAEVGVALFAAITTACVGVAVLFARPAGRGGVIR